VNSTHQVKDIASFVLQLHSESIYRLQLRGNLHDVYGEPIRGRTDSGVVAYTLSLLTKELLMVGGDVHHDLLKTAQLRTISVQMRGHRVQGSAQFAVEIPGDS